MIKWEDLPTAFWAAAACNAFVFTWIGFPSGLMIVTVLPKIQFSDGVIESLEIKHWRLVTIHGFKILTMLLNDK